jgi:nucleotide-binding universal stress UspA family protein
MKEPVTRILVPLDGSRLAEAVLPLTVYLAGKLGAVVSLLHIIEENAPATRHGEPHLTTPPEAERYLLDVASRFAGPAAFEHHVHATEENNVALSIARHTEELSADMVALCTHGRSDPMRVVFGSIADQVLRRVSEPVLLVRPGESVPASITKVLVPIDGEHPTGAPLALASRIALACDAEVELVSVVPTVNTLTGDRLSAARLTPIATAAALDAEEVAAGTSLQSHVGSLQAAGNSVSSAVRRGDVVNTLASLADTSGASLIVIATHASAGLRAVWGGSVAHALAQRVSQPMLLVKL